MPDSSPEPSTTLKVDLVVPVYNEEAGLPEFFQRIQALDFSTVFDQAVSMQVIFIDNASSDNSLAMLETFPAAIVIEHAENEGYGGSILDGIESGESPYIIIIDADCEYPPECIPELLKATQDNPIVHTSRFLHRDSAVAANMPWLKMFGNKIISGLFNHLFKQQTTDLYTGCKGLQRAAVEKLELQQKGFEHVLELAVQMVAQGHDISEVPVEFRARITGSSKMSHVSETLKYLYWLVRYARRFRTGKL